MLSLVSVVVLLEYNSPSLREEVYTANAFYLSYYLYIASYIAFSIVTFYSYARVIYN